MLTRTQASDITNAVKADPALGLPLILQLTGVHGSQHFDRLTRTKTVEGILANMHPAGIEAYIRYLLDQVNDAPGAPCVPPPFFFILWKEADVVGWAGTCPR